MKDTSLFTLEKNQELFLKKYGLDEESKIEFMKKIKKTSKEQAQILGKQLFDLVTRKDFNDDYEKALELIYKGANIEYKNEKKGDFVLLICARKNYFKTFLVLAKAGCNVNQVNNYLTTAVMTSARHGNREILEILINMQADINLRCLDGDNAIMCAKRHSQIACFDLLVDSSAYLNNQNIYNQTVEDIPGTVYSRFIKSKSKSKKSSDKKNALNEYKNLLDELDIKLKKYQKM